jgi:hypothetical protein
MSASSWLILRTCSSRALDEHRGQSALCLEQRAWQLLKKRTVPLGQCDAELVEQAAQFIGLHDPHFHQLCPQPMQGQHNLLRIVLDRNELDSRLLTSSPDCVRVGGVGLVAMHEGANHLRRQKPHLVTEQHQLPSPLVRPATGFHHHERRLPIGECLPDRIGKPFTSVLIEPYLKCSISSANAAGALSLR